jgi:hypothetical protein
MRSNTPTLPEGSNRKNKVKFHCAQCGQNAWGKPNLKISCTPCGLVMPAVNMSVESQQCSTKEPDQVAIA